MKEIEFLAVGDLHIGKHKIFFKNDDNYIKPVIDILYKAVEYCKINGIDYLILLGDIFDNPNPTDYERMQFFNFLNDNSHNWLKKYLIIGNHDFMKVKHHSMVFAEWLKKYGMFNNVHLYNEKIEIVKLEGIPFCFIPYPFNYAIKTNYPKINIGHYEINGAKRDTGNLVKNLDVDICKNDYYIMGHIHLYQVLGNVIYCGTPLQNKFSEKLPKGFVHFNIKQYKKNNKYKLKCNYKFIKIETPYQLINIKVENEKDLNKILKDKNILYKVFIKNQLKMKKDDIMKLYPNIINVIGYKNDKELKTYINNTISINSIDNIIDPTYSLYRFLRQKDLSVDDSRFGVRKINEIIETLKL